MNDEEKTSEKGGAGRCGGACMPYQRNLVQTPALADGVTAAGFARGGQFCVLSPRTSEPVRRKLTDSPEPREPKRYPLRPLNEGEPRCNSEIE